MTWLLVLPYIGDIEQLSRDPMELVRNRVLIVTYLTSMDKSRTHGLFDVIFLGTKDWRYGPTQDLSACIQEV